MSAETLVSAEQLLRMPDDGHRYELIAGRLIMMAPAGWEHGAVGWDLAVILGEHVRKNKLGRMFLAETGFLLGRDPDTVRAPDAAFIRKDHLPTEPPEEAYWPGAPDLAVEVVSPDDTKREVAEKALAWLAAGCALVWVVEPRAHTITVYRLEAEAEVLSVDDELDGGQVAPGFRCQVREVFQL